MLTTLRFNLANTAIRHEMLHGKGYVVAPMAMLTEGVHSGSSGPLLYREADIKRAAPAWNMKPIVVYHPQINGQGVSACDPTILEAQQVGIIMNARWNGGKLRAEAWIEEARANIVDARVTEALEANKLMEVSTGLFTDNVNEEGEWKGELYKAIATNHQPDHLALLPDQIGACSIADGAGLLQLNEAACAAGVDVTGLMARQMDVLRRMVGNAMSHANIYSALNRALRERFKPSEKQNIWIADVYDTSVIYEIEGDGKVTLFQLGYTSSETGVVKLSAEDPVEVVRVTEYRTPSGEFVGNKARTESGVKVMDKKKIVDGLITNKMTAWGEGDREVLMGMEEGVLVKLVPVTNDEGKAEDDKKVQPVVNTATDPVQVQMTTKQYIANAPPEIREVLTNGLAAHEAEKAKLIEAITANKANAFTPEFLAGKGLQELRGLAALAGARVVSTDPPMFYGGAATPANAPVANVDDKDDLMLPTMNFGAEAQEFQATTA